MRAYLVVPGIVGYLWPTSDVRLEGIPIPATPLCDDGPPVATAVVHILIGAHID